MTASGECAFGYCKAPLIGRGRSRYCSEEHAEAARSRRTVAARAAREAEAAYERISHGEGEPPPHLGWVKTTRGVVLDGTTVVELQALIDTHRREMGALSALVKGAGANPRALQAHLDQHVAAVDRVLLQALHTILNQRRPLRPGSKPQGGGPR